MREISVTEALGWRLRAQHLDAPLGPGALAEAAGADTRRGRMQR